MPAASTTAPLLLVIVLLSSSIAKARDLDSTVSVITLLRLPRPMSRRGVACALVVAEALLAVALVSPWPNVFLITSVACLVLFATYWVLVVRAMTFDPRPTCGCFGLIGDQSISAKTVVRNTLLLVTATVTVALANHGTTIASLLDHADARPSWWVVGIVVAMTLGLLIGSRPAGPVPRAQSTPEPPGHVDYIRTPVPLATVQAPTGAPLTLRELANDRAQLLVAVNCACGSTQEALAALAGWRARLPAIDVRVLATMPRQLLSALQPTGAASEEEAIYYDHGSVVWNQLVLGQSPAGVLLGADGLLAGGPVSGMDMIERIVAAIEEAFAEEAEAAR